MKYIYSPTMTGILIKTYRKKRNMTQAELASAIGKTESSIRKYESGSTQIPLAVVCDIASAVNAMPFFLIDFEVGADE